MAEHKFASSLKTQEHNWKIQQPYFSDLLMIHQRAKCRQDCQLLYICKHLCRTNFNSRCWKYKKKYSLPSEKVRTIPWLLRCPITLLARVSFLKFHILLPFLLMWEVSEILKGISLQKVLIRFSWLPIMLSYLEDCVQLVFTHERFSFDLWGCPDFICIISIIRKPISSFCIEVKVTGNEKKL